MTNPPRIPRTRILGAATLADFKAGLHGEVLGPDDPHYDAARAVWNAMIDKRPILIARCAGVADVLAALQFARSHDLPLAARGGGHNVAGTAVCDDGIVIDLSPMKGIRVDAAHQVARVQAGATWGEFDREAATFGLATTGGMVSTTGVAGLTLGGGIGWLMRRYGLACDNLLSADIVTADGRCLTTSAFEYPDLFWGVRGGGGNFGIVTSFEFRLHQVTTVLGGMVLHPISRAQELLRFFREYTESAPDELTAVAAFLVAPPAPFLPPALHGQTLVAVAVCYCGVQDVGEAALRPLRAFGPPLADLIGPLPYTALQTMTDAAAPAGLYNFWKSHYLKTLSDEAIAVIAGHAPRLLSPFSVVHIHHLSGAVSRVGAAETAVGYRDVPYILNIVGSWEDRGTSGEQLAWVRAFWDAMCPHATGGTYVNFLGDEGAARVRAAYGSAIYERLAALKDRYDPANLFRGNHNIPPLS